MSNDIEKRFRLHKNNLKNNKHGNSYLQNSWNKYGEENFKFIILEECESINLNDREKYYIKYYNSINRKYGYNRTTGGSNGKHLKETIELIRSKHIGLGHTEETKEKIRKIKTGVIVLENTKVKMSQSQKENYKNNTRRKEIAQQQGFKNKGSKRSEENKQKMRNAQLGKTLSEEQKIKIGKSRKITSEEQDILIYQLLLEGSLPYKEIGNIVGVPKHIVVDRKRKQKFLQYIENKNVNLNIKILLKKIINTYLEKGCNIDEIPKTIHNLAYKYKYNLVKLIEEEDVI